MMRRIALFASLWALSACATPSGSLPPPPAVEQPAPRAPDPRICAKVDDPPTLPAGADLVRPVTPEEARAFAIFMTFGAVLVDHDRRVTDQARLAAAGPGCAGGRSATPIPTP